MRRVVLLVGKDLRRKFRAPLGLVVTLLFPLLFAGMIALVFGSGGDKAPKVRLLVQNKDDGMLASALSSAMASDRMAEHFDVRLVGDEGRALMENGEASALLVIPERFTRDVLSGRATTLSLVRNPAEGILPEVAEQLASILVQLLDGGARVLRGPLDEMRPYFEKGANAPADASIAALSISVKRAIEGAGKYVFPPAITLEGAFAGKSADDKKAAGAGEGTSAIFLLVLPGVAVYALFLVGDQAMRDVLTETVQGTLRRQLAGPVGPGTIVLAKAVYTAALSILALVALTAVGAAVLRHGVDPLGFAVLSLALVLAISGASAAIYGFARTERRGATVASVLYLFMAFAGGSFVPLQSLPAIVRRVAPATPFYWGNRGFQTLLADHGGLRDVLPHAAVLAALGLALLALGAFALGRAVRRGGAA